MTPQISFFAPGIPKGQPRPRAFARNMGGGKFVARVFDSGTAEAWKADIANEAARNKPAAPITGPVKLRLVFMLPRPKGHFVSGRAERGLRPFPYAPTFHTGKPDADNLAKAVMDCLTQLGWFWGDDAQVSQLVVVKHYAHTSTTGVLIEIGEAAA